MTDVAFLMKGPWTSIAAEELPSFPAHLTFIEVFRIWVNKLITVKLWYCLSPGSRWVWEVSFLDQALEGPPPAAHAQPPVLGPLVASFDLKLLEGELLPVLGPYAFCRDSFFHFLLVQHPLHLTAGHGKYRRFKVHVCISGNSWTSFSGSFQRPSVASFYPF